MEIQKPIITGLGLAVAGAGKFAQSSVATSLQRKRAIRSDNVGPVGPARSSGRSAFFAAAACAVCALPGVATAQSVSIYGLIDSGVEVVTNVGASRARIVRVPSLTASLPSRLGFRGSEDLGGGLQTVFVLEQGFSPDSGVLNQGGRAFGRQAFVGLSGPWGTLSLGRQYSQILASLIGDTMGPNIYGAGLLDPYLPNARLDNSIAYRGTFDGLTVGATYSLGRDTVAPAAAGGCAGESATDSKACRDISGAVQYATKSWGAALAFEKMKGGAGPGPLPLSSQTDTRSVFSGFTMLGAAKLGAGWIHRKNEGAVKPVSDFWFIGGAYPVGNLSFDLQYGHIRIKDTADAASVIAARAMYSFSKRTAVYVTSGHVSNKGGAAFTIDGGVAVGSAPLPGVGQTGFMVGVRHTF